MKRCLQPKIIVAVLTMMLLVGTTSVARASSFANSHGASAPSLGTSVTFAVLGATTVINTGSTNLKGDLGVSPGTSCTGFASPCAGGSGTVSGTIHVADSVAAQAQTDAASAYASAIAQTCTTTYPPATDIGGSTLTSGVYCFPSSAAVTGTLTLDAQGNPDAAFIFDIGSTLTTASASSVVLINGTQSKNVFFQVGDSATLGAATTFTGSIVALNSITAGTGVTSSSGLYALNGAVTLDSDSIQRDNSYLKLCFSSQSVSSADQVETTLSNGLNDMSNFGTSYIGASYDQSGFTVEPCSGDTSLTYSFSVATTRLLTPEGYNCETATQSSVNSFYINTNGFWMSYYGVATRTIFTETLTLQATDSVTGLVGPAQQIGYRIYYYG